MKIDQIPTTTKSFIVRHEQSLATFLDVSFFISVLIDFNIHQQNKVGNAQVDPFCARGWR